MIKQASTARAQFVRWTLAGVLAVCGGCSRAADPALLRQANELGKQSKWEEAIPLLREYMVAEPNSVGGHFLLGQAYLHVPRPRFSVAIGELRTAEALYRRAGTLGDFSTLAPPADFMLLYHQERALAHLRLAYEGLRQDFPAHLVDTQLSMALGQVEEGLRARPDYPFLLDMKQELERQLSSRPSARAMGR